MTLKYGLGVIQGHRKMAPFESSDMVSYLHSKVTIFIILDKKQDIGQNHDFFICPLHVTLSLGGPHRNIAIKFGTEKSEWCGYQTVKKV